MFIFWTWVTVISCFTAITTFFCAFFEIIEMNKPLAWYFVLQLIPNLYLICWIGGRWAFPDEHDIEARKYY